MFQIRIFKDKTARHFMLGITILSLFLLFAIGFGLAFKAWPIIKEKSVWQLLTSSNWKPFKGDFGFLPYMISTIYITMIAIIIALPLSLLTGIYLSEYANERVKKIFAPVIDLLSGIPPVIYGVWGTLTVVPFISTKLAPHFVEFSTGYSVLAGGAILAVMIIPLIISILNEVFSAIPREMREASLSLGATKWQTVKKVVLRKSSPGIIAAVVLALSRAFGETIAVLMVCGNLSDIPHSLFDSCYPLPALIANNYGEMLSLPTYESALMFSALMLFVIIVLFNAGSRIILSRMERKFQL
ncbi:MAG: phosphate ABC transporter permease subunit PstC [Bacteroidota bacterium]|nr:phosphate ABC transporter permease subunit PstC [Bacteroidota bacterium]MDP4207078.1 phosphate ABC transporter permease subunit PstC [Bacteroidota bacterium]